MSFWENYGYLPKECSNTEIIDPNSAHDSSQIKLIQAFFRRIMAHNGSAHTVNDIRIDNLRKELVRWETERRAALLRLQNPTQKSVIDLMTA